MNQVATPGCPSADTILAYLDGQLAAEGRAAVDEHKRDCAACRDLVALALTSEDGPAASEVLFAGTQVGRFVVGGILGIGGMGVVYAAADPDLGRPVALKLLRAESEERRERLAREAQALARV